MLEEASRGKLRSTTPVFLVGDIASTMLWYRENLGFEADAFPKSPPHAFAILSRDGVQIMLQQLAGYEKPDFVRPAGRGSLERLRPDGGRPRSLPGLVGKRERASFSSRSNGSGTAIPNS